LERGEPSSSFHLFPLAGPVGVFRGPLCKHDIYVKTFIYLLCSGKKDLRITTRLNKHTARNVQTRVGRGSSAFRPPTGNTRRASMSRPDYVRARPVGRGQSKGRKVCHGIRGRGPTKQPTSKLADAVSLVGGGIVSTSGSSVCLLFAPPTLSPSPSPPPASPVTSRPRHMSEPKCLNYLTVALSQPTVGKRLISAYQTGGIYICKLIHWLLRR